ncbi:hypothetical protein H5410_011121 [Solanum commersonii]|uniref:Uncharacterized protein n=1 Tax=Solanum commersonii TaxID=4109 RepID=A0A9J6APA4_SOLCO|nr:hypothetical protein H5410_011121 [Solanum commersonii]
MPKNTEGECAHTPAMLLLTKTMSQCGNHPAKIIGVSKVFFSSGFRRFCITGPCSWECTEILWQ